MQENILLYRMIHFYQIVALLLCHYYHTIMRQFNWIYDFMS